MIKKNILGIFLFILVLFLGCDSDSVFKDSYSITNSSSNDATFTIKETGDKYSLAVGESESYTLYDYPKITITSKYHQTYSYDDGDVIISDMTKYSLHIENKYSKKVIVTEDNDLLEEYGDKIEIVANGTKDTSVYGLDFTAVDENGYKRECQLSKKSDAEEDKNSYYLIIE